MPDLVVSAIGSDGSIDQWNGVKSPTGILLRWFPGVNLGFPDRGYTVYRRESPSPKSVAIPQLAPTHGGLTFATPDQALKLVGTGLGMQSPPQSALVVQPGGRLTLSCLSPAWYLSLTPAVGVGAGLRVDVYAGGTLQETRNLRPGAPAAVWITRGVERLEISGDGALSALSYSPISDVDRPGSWRNLKHLCLPVGSPGCPVASPGWPEAKARLPLAVSQNARLGVQYQAAFVQMMPYLAALSAGRLAQPLPNTQQAASSGATLNVDLDSNDALSLALDDPNIARMVGIAWDDPLEGNRLDGKLYAYKVEGIWNPAPNTTNAISRVAILPAVAAVSAAVPVTPQNLRARLSARGGAGAPLALSASLDWDIALTARGAYPEFGNIFHQAVGKQLGSDPAATAPEPVPADGLPLLPTAPLRYVPPRAILTPSLQGFFVESGITEGWRAWWVRGVDIFGRASAPSRPVIAAIVDNTPPPPPILVTGEYVQADLPQTQAALAGWSWLARAWNAANPTSNAAVLGWAWSPELDALCPDADGFQVYSRRPANVENGQDGWGTRLLSLGPIPLRFAGHVASVDQSITLNVSAIHSLATASITPDHFALETDLRLASGAGALIGARLTLAAGGGSDYLVAAASSGDNAPLIAMTPPHATAPVPGMYQVSRSQGGPLPPSASALLTVATDIQPPAWPGGWKQRQAGVLTVSNVRLEVLGVAAGAQAGGMRFLCSYADDPHHLTALAAGAAATWYPAYTAVLRDDPATGFGPRPNPADTPPVASAQLSVTTVRRTASRPVESVKSTSAMITAVDTHRPDPPAVTSPPSGPYCAEVASAADWYGISRFTLSWIPDTSSQYRVYRALGETVCLLDHSAHRQGAAVNAHTIPPASLPAYVDHALVTSDFTNLDMTLSTRYAALSADARQVLDSAHAEQESHTRVLRYTFPQSVWAPAVWSNVARRQAILAELDSLDRAVRDAYEALHADSQRYLGGLDLAKPAYATRTGHGLPAGTSSYTDRIEGRSRAHWFYRAAAVANNGIESDWSPPTPPICCPDEVPPTTPRMLTALTDKQTGRIVITWQAVPDADLDHYELFRTGDAATAATAATSAGDVMPTVASIPAFAAAAQSTVSYTDATAPANRDSFYWVSAVDKSGKPSPASNIVVGRAILLPPEPPAWNPPRRSGNSVVLGWMHSSDQRLACLVESRNAGSGLWVDVSGWLPRGEYQFTDTPPIESLSYDYRLSVRDHHNQEPEADPPLTNVSGAS